MKDVGCSYYNLSHLRDQTKTQRKTLLQVTDATRNFFSLSCPIADRMKRQKCFLLLNFLPFFFPAGGTVFFQRRSVPAPGFIQLAQLDSTKNFCVSTQLENQRKKSCAVNQNTIHCSRVVAVGFRIRTAQNRQGCTKKTKIHFLKIVINT